MEESLKKKTLLGLIWQYAEKCGAQLINFVVSIILARILVPADYGLVGLIAVFISVLLVFAQSGMGQALVQKKEADDEDVSTVFYYSFVFSVIIYIGLFFAAPYIAKFYNEMVLTEIIRVLGLTVIMGAVNSVQQARIQKDMRFKIFFYATVSGTAVSAIVGICMAYSGYGVWALVWQQLSSRIITTIVLWFTANWRPMWIFSFRKMKQLFGYSWKLLASGLLDTVYNNIYSLLIGKFYSSADLGYYNRGKQFPILIVENVRTTTHI